MTTNQTIDGVPRELLERIREKLNQSDYTWLTNDPEEELRALLDGSGCKECEDVGYHVTMGVQRSCWACKPAAKPQGETIYQLEYLGEGGGGWNDVDKATYERFERLPNYRPRIVYAEQPAPVAVEPPAGPDRISMKRVAIFGNGGDNPIIYTMNGTIVNLDDYVLIAPGVKYEVTIPNGGSATGSEKHRGTTVTPPSTK